MRSLRIQRIARPADGGRAAWAEVTIPFLVVFTWPPPRGHPWSGHLLALMAWRGASPKLLIKLPGREVHQVVALQQRGIGCPSWLGRYYQRLLEFKVADELN